MAKFLPEVHTAVSAAAAAVVLASDIDVEEGRTPRCRPGEECASQVLFDIISSRSALVGPENDSKRGVDLQSTIHTDIGRSSAGAWPTVGGKFSTSRTRSRRNFGSSSCSLQ